MNIWYASINFHEFLRLFVYYYFFFLQKINKMHTAIRIRYPDIRKDLSKKIFGYSISDGYQTYCIRIRYPNKISVFVSFIRKKSGYPKILSELVFTIFKSRSGRIFSEPYYIPNPKTL
jgi:hypothetical protein